MGLYHSSKKTVSAFEAKTHLSQLLLEVQEEGAVTITRRGKPVAQLVPLKQKSKKSKKMDAIHQFEAIREGIKGNVNIKSYINEGHKY